jgi:hypothetical protein
MRQGVVPPLPPPPGNPACWHTSAATCFGQKRRVDQTLQEARIASQHAATLPLRPSAHVPAAAVGPDLPHSLAHDLEPSLQRPWRGPRRRRRRAAAAAARAGCPLRARDLKIDYQPAKRLGHACATRRRALNAIMRS